MLDFDISHPIVTGGSRVSRTPPHHTLRAFLNLNCKRDTIILKASLENDSRNLSLRKKVTSENNTL